ncbi:glycoside hydrolase family 88/105 protein [Prolixibacter bellariivorans]|nr:glycoside hydrolase family 88 protein [Prolixibacter bellariivorans]
MKVIFYLSIIAFLFTHCDTSKKTKNKENTNQKPYSLLMAESVMNNNPKAWTVDYQSKPNWGYVQGLVCKALLREWEETGNPKYFNYVKNTYADVLIDSTGNILGYKKKDFKLDDINSGKILFALYKKTRDMRYKKAIETLRDQLREQPRIPQGGFWHKKIYTNQMWLDGLYMEAPFYAQYIATFGNPSNFDDVTNQFLLVEKHLKDPKTGLYYHGWDESKSVFWADPKTGLSKSFWGRGIGWLYMATIDVLDFLPKNHKDHNKLVNLFKNLTDAIIHYQQKDSGVWYQVMNMPGRKGNYLESSCSTMFTYGMIKGIETGILDSSYIKPAMKAYNGILATFVKTDKNGNLEITSGCSGAGLGPAGNTRRDGTFKYYISEPVRSNDGKAIGPFIMESLLIESNPVLRTMVK